MVFEIAAAQTLATVSSIAVSLATRTGSSSMQLFNPTTLALTPGVLPYSIEGGTTVPW